jgi:pyridoxal phosphate enzyme (YggS family)
MNIAENIDKIKKEIPQGVDLVAVTKTRTSEEIMEAYKAGQRIFGENRVLEMLDKYRELPQDIEWHMIGHLQTNKVKYIAPFVSLIHSVDSLKLLKRINNEAAKKSRVIDCLLEIKIAREESKYGLAPPAANSILDSAEYRALDNIRIRGLMGMASNTHDTDHIRREFRGLKEYFSRIKESYFKSDDGFSELSMGMSGDYKIAIEEGSTMIRVGSRIFS